MQIKHWQAAHPDYHRLRRERLRATAGMPASRGIAPIRDTPSHRHDRERSYGLPAGWIGEALAAQAGKCSICDVDITAATAHIDHDHDTGQVRALLCRRCNYLLGYAGGNAGHLLVSALVYLCRYSPNEFNTDAVLKLLGQKGRSA